MWDSLFTGQEPRATDSRRSVHRKKDTNKYGLESVLGAGEKMRRDMQTGPFNWARAEGRSKERQESHNSGWFKRRAGRKGRRHCPCKKAVQWFSLC